MYQDNLLEKRIGAADLTALGEGEHSAIPLYNNRGVLEVDDRLSRPRVKTAAAEEAVAAALKVKPDPSKVYVLVVGLGAEEFWGVNNNGDSFPENALLGLPPKGVSMSFFDRYAARLPKEWGFKTFRKAHVFEEHRNTSPKLSIGDVVDTFWNNRMRRVENLIGISREKGKKWAEKVDNGLGLATSMACRVPFDRCSLCGNLAPTRVTYCGHLRAGHPQYALRQIGSDGKPVAMINDFPVFFDESCVETPAAPEALMIMKVASDKAAGKKEAEHVKTDPELPLDVAMDDLAGLYATERPLPDVVVEKLSHLGLPAALKAAADLGMCLRPSEVFRITYGMNALNTKEAADLDRKALSAHPSQLSLTPWMSLADRARRPLTRDGSAVKQASWDVAAINLLRPFAAGRSYQEPHLTGRLMKAASVRWRPEHLSDTDRGLLGMYHALYQAACGDFGYGPKQAALAYVGRRGDY